MKDRELITIPNFRLIRLVLIVAAFAVAESCSVTLVAPYKEKIAQDIQQVAKKIDIMYLTMLEANSPSDRKYVLFAESYIDIEADLNSLLLQNRLRPLNRESTRNNEIALETWIKYKQIHKKENELNDFDIDLNRDYFRDLFMVLLLGEEVRKND